MKNERGFALTLLVALLPVFLAGGAALFVFMGLLEDRFSRQNSCRRHLLVGLEKAGLSMKDLLTLNPSARSLRRQVTATMAALAAAVASGNPAAVTVAQRRLSFLKNQQRLLDLRQKSLYLKAQTELSTAQLQARASLHQSTLGFIAVRASFPRVVKPALRPDAPGPGPIYVLENPFEEKQALVQKWQSQFQLRGPLSNFLNARGRFEEKCAATLKPQGDRWRARLAEDKSWSKR